MSLTDQFLRADSLTVQPGSTTLNLGLPWFRSLPWAAITDAQIEIDDHSFNASQIQVQTPAGYLPFTVVNQRDRYQRTTDEWFVQDRHNFQVPVELEANREYPVRIQFQMVMPNLFAAPGVPIALPTQASATLVAQPATANQH